MPLSFGFTSGIPPTMGKRLLFIFENGSPVTSVFDTIPATTRADGCDPPIMSCMKNESVGCFPAGIAGVDAAVLVLVTGEVAAGRVGVIGSGSGFCSSLSSPEIHECSIFFNDKRMSLF